MLQSEREKMMTMQEHQTAYVQRASFSREGATVFLGHLDLMTCFERAARRAGLPILYSQGYNPRPMMVFALPLGVGIETRCDYLDVSLKCPYDAEKFTQELNAFLPTPSPSQDAGYQNFTSFFLRLIFHCMYIPPFLNDL